MIKPSRSGIIERSMFDAIVVVAPRRPGPRFDAEDVVTADDHPAPIFELHDHLAGEDLQSQDPALPLGRHDPRADGRQLTLEGLIRVKLVAQAALQPPAT